MKIHIKADGHNIRLWLPTSLLKTRIFYHILRNGVEKNEKNDKNETRFRFTFQSRKQQLEAYAVLKRAIRQHGHFNLVEVDNADGEKVLIRV